MVEERKQMKKLTEETVDVWCDIEVVVDERVRAGIRRVVEKLYRRQFTGS